MHVLCKKQYWTLPEPMFLTDECENLKKLRNENNDDSKLGRCAKYATIGACKNDRIFTLDGSKFYPCESFSLKSVQTLTNELVYKQFNVSLLQKSYY